MYPKCKQMEKIIFTVPQLAEYLDISERTIREYLRDSRLKGFKKLNKWFIFFDDVVSFIKS